VRAIALKQLALLKVMNDIMLGMNSQCVTLLVLLYLSAAFDTVNHGIALFHYDVTSKQSIVLTPRIMVARGDKTAAKQINSQYNFVYDIVESESS
jgi:hypothetical protein